VAILAADVGYSRLMRGDGEATAAGSIAVPAVLAAAGEHAARRFLEFFAANIRNKNTRLAYYRAVCG
jgi:hypothetical protein